MALGRATRAIIRNTAASVSGLSGVLCSSSFPA
eukprot:CAMPEP_0197935826 /NCGR_PEP_ID=MMETSP1439-20131203/113969_2 /TAXON_ID=66791 /ORGANISM="Gonyaulax spinifera, Strain CCMP409" /LENGTH=32 /DNA_ID= /DNA_START= /DNA_END= /DNA_ORIENTATION=